MNKAYRLISKDGDLDQFEKVPRFHDMEQGDVFYVKDNHGKVIFDPILGTKYCVMYKPNGVLEDGRQMVLAYPLIYVWARMESVNESYMIKYGKDAKCCISLELLLDICRDKLNDYDIISDDYIIENYKQEMTNNENVMKGYEFHKKIQNVILTDLDLYQKKKKGLETK